MKAVFMGVKWVVSSREDPLVTCETRQILYFPNSPNVRLVVTVPVC